MIIITPNSFTGIAGQFAALEDLLLESRAVRQVLTTCSEGNKKGREVSELIMAQRGRLADLYDELETKLKRFGVLAKVSGDIEFRLKVSRVHATTFMRVLASFVSQCQTTGAAAPEILYLVLNGLRSLAAKSFKAGWYYFCATGTHDLVNYIRSSALDLSKIGKDSSLTSFDEAVKTLSQSEKVQACKDVWIQGIIDGSFTLVSSSGVVRPAVVETLIEEIHARALNAQDRFDLGAVIDKVRGQLIMANLKSQEESVKLQIGEAIKVFTGLKRQVAQA